MNLRVAQHVAGTNGTRIRIGVGKFPGLHQMQRAQSHGLQRTCRSPDIARMTGMHQYDANIFEWVVIIH